MVEKIKEKLEGIMAKQILLKLLIGIVISAILAAVMTFSPWFR